MARLNEDLAPGPGPRLSTLPTETAEDAVVCSLDWLKVAAKTPDGLEQAFQYIIATVHERDRLTEEHQTQNAQIENLQTCTETQNIQIEELIAERDQLSFELL